MDSEIRGNRHTNGLVQDSGPTWIRISRLARHLGVRDTSKEYLEGLFASRRVDQKTRNAWENSKTGALRDTGEKVSPLRAVVAALLDAADLRENTNAVSFDVVKAKSLEYLRSTKGRDISTVPVESIRSRVQDGNVTSVSVSDQKLNARPVDAPSDKSRAGFTVSDWVEPGDEGLRVFFFSTSFVHVPNADAIDGRITVQIPPVTCVNGRIDLDFKRLIVADRIYMDFGSFEWLKTIPVYGVLADSIDRLVETRRIVLRNFPAIDPQKFALIPGANESELNDPVRWLPALRVMLREWNRVQPIFVEGLGAEYDELKIGKDFGILNMLKRDGKELTIENVERVESLIDRANYKWSEPYEIDMLREVIRPYIHEMHIITAVQKALKRPFLDWKTMDLFYQKKYQIGLEDPLEKNFDQLSSAKASELLTTGLPKLAPGDVAAYLRIKEHSDHAELIRYIDESAATGRVFDGRFAEDVAKKRQAAEELTGGDPVCGYEWLYVLLDSASDSRR